MMNATVVRTTRAVCIDLYNKNSFFIPPGTKCFVNPLTYKADASGKIVKRVIFDRNIPEELKTLEVVLADGQKVSLDYLLPESHTTSFRTVVFDNV